MISKLFGKRRPGELLLIYLVLVLTSLVVLIPIYIVFTAAFKNENDIFFKTMALWTEDGGLFNFARLNRFPRYILNSLKIAVSCTLIQAVTSASGAYAFSKLRWRGRDFIFLLYLITIMIPVQVVVIPQFLIVRTLGLYNTHLGIILIGSFSAYSVFLIKQFMMTIPDSLLESARIDGASEFRIFSMIIIPLSRTVLAVVIIFAFRWFWNDFFLPLIYLTSSELKTLPLGLSDFVTEYDIQYGPQMAAAMISLIPVMIIFLFSQRFFVEGIVSTGIKG